MKKKIRKIIQCAAIFILAIALNMNLNGCAAKTATALKNYSSPAGLNTDKTLKILGSWTKTGIMNHYHTGTDGGPIIMYGVEGLIQNVRTTNKYYYILAESVEHKDDHTSLIHIRPEAKWQNGDDFTAMDVIAYYAIDYMNEITRYFSKIEAVDNKTVKITWKTYREPTKEAKTMLIAMDTKSGSVSYKEFKYYVDRALKVINGLPDVTKEDLAIDSMYSVQPYGKMWDGVASAAMGSVLNEMRSYNPNWYVATGPYKLEKYTETEMILSKNKNYYLDNSKAFDKIIVYQTPSNSNQVFSMLESGQLDYADGCPLPEMIDQVVNNSENMVHYKMYDQGAVGIYYNLEKEIWSDPKVREAFEYIFDRESIKNLSQPYGTTCWYSYMTMTPQQAEVWMRPEDFKKLKTYSFDQVKAKSLLESAGWTKKGNSWYDKKGNKLSLTLGAEGTTLFTNIAQAVQSSLNAFGIETYVKTAADWNTWFSTARKENSPYDFVVGVTALNQYTTHPNGFFKHMFDVLCAHAMHLPVSEDTSRWDLKLNKVDGTGTVELTDELDKLFLVEGDELKKTTGNIVYGFAEYNYGITFFENVTGSFFNAGRVWGLPASKKIGSSRNITYIPKVTDPEFEAFAKLNVWFTQESVYGLGEIYPRD